jgi:hypothetical protein
VEGDDISMLKRLQNTIFPTSEEPFDAIPNFDIEGWGGWNYAKGSKLLLRDTVDDSIKIYCLFDSDYHTNSQKNKRLDDAKSLGVQCHIWKKKELENYLVIPTAILRIIKAKKHTIITVADIEKKISEIAKQSEEEIVDNFATEIQSEDKKKAINTCRKEAKTYIDKLENRISGKELISQLSKWTHDQFRVNLNPITLAKNIELPELDPELVKVITAIERGMDF